LPWAGLYAAAAGGMHPSAVPAQHDVPVSGRRALIAGLRRSRSAEVWRAAATGAPPVFWGRVGIYEGVTRDGMLLLLAPDSVHPALRVKSGP
jgi:hypothetical protein